MNSEMNPKPLERGVQAPVYVVGIEIASGDCPASLMKVV